MCSANTLNCGSFVVYGFVTVATTGGAVNFGAVSGSGLLSLTGASVFNATSWTGTISMAVTGGGTISVKSGAATLNSLVATSGVLNLYGQSFAAQDLTLASNSWLIGTNGLPFTTTRVGLTLAAGQPAFELRGYVQRVQSCVYACNRCVWLSSCDV